MEKRPQNIGIISGDSFGMADNKFHTKYSGESPHSSIDPLFGPLNRHFNTSFLTLHKTKMAELKVAWIITNILGWPVYVFSVIQNLDNIKSVVLLVLGAIFMGVKIWQSYEKGRTTKIANDRQQFQLDCEKWDKEDERKKKQELSKIH